MTAVGYAIWFLVSLAVSASVTPLVRALAHRLGLLDRPGGQSYKWHARATPYLGGVPIVLATGLAILLGGLSGETGRELQTIFLAAALCSIMGAIDDWRPIGATAKLVTIMISGSLVWIAGVGTNMSPIPGTDLILTLLWLAAITNAFNIIDNMDGVAVGIAGLAALSYFGVAIVTAQPHYALVSISIAGACLGFLRFNFQPATIFLGDLGTMYLGLLLASIGMGLDVPAASIPTRIVTAALIMGVPLFNLLLVIASRLRAGRPVTCGARDGISHRLIAIGLTRADAAKAYWLASAALGVAGVSVSTLGTDVGVVAITACFLLTLVAIWGFEQVRVDELDSTFPTKKPRIWNQGSQPRPGRSKT